jgi:hypothetical protein
MHRLGLEPNQIRVVKHQMKKVRGSCPQWPRRKRLNHSKKERSNHKAH